MIGGMASQKKMQKKGDGWRHHLKAPTAAWRDIMDFDGVCSAPVNFLLVKINLIVL